MHPTTHELTCSATDADKDEAGNVDDADAN